LWMDRSVISRLERDGYLTFVPEGREPWFELTDEGRRYIEAGTSVTSSS
jgi:DNA-binding PadR family transcriptional regulator